MFWKYNFLGISWAVFIMILSGLPGDQFDRAQQQDADLAIHAILFGVLSFLLTVGFIKQNRFRRLRTKTIWKVLVIAVLYGVIIELLQATVFVGRSIEAVDMLSNAFGAVVGLLVFGSVYGLKEYT